MGGSNGYRQRMLAVTFEGCGFTERGGVWGEGSGGGGGRHVQVLLTGACMVGSFCGV